jgi:hypothetical protein
MRKTLTRLVSSLLTFLAFGPSLASANVGDAVVWQRARGVIEHRRPTRWLADGSPDPDSYEAVGEPEVTYNLITNAGRDFLHQQGYASSGLGANGLNYIALSNDTVGEGAGSTTLSAEIAANGLTRAQGTVTHTAGTNTTTIAKTFTCATASQAAQKAALFTASSGGTMCHVLAFTQRTLQVGDTLTVTFTVTLG